MNGESGKNKKMKGFSYSRFFVSSFFLIVGYAEDTHARQNKNKKSSSFILFCSHLIVPLQSENQAYNTNELIR